MVTVVVSSSAQLAAALKAPAAGTTIELESGSYTLSIRAKDLAGTVITTADGASASFSSLSLQSASHLTFDGVDFLDRSGTSKPFVVANSTDVTINHATIDGTTPNGYGVGNGLWISNNTGFTLANSQITDFQTGAWVGGNTDLTIRDNSFSNITLDGMIIGKTHDALFKGNTIDLHSTPGLRHSDGMQFYNSGDNAPSTGITIEDNVIRTHNALSHGIYMANAIANSTGNTNAFFQDVLIDNNTILNADGFGIAWGQTQDLTIRDNIILRDIDVTPASVRGNVPHILVHQDSTNVTIVDNTTHLAPWVADAEWQPTNRPEPTWTVGPNNIVPLGTTLDDLGPHDPVGNGQPDIFRFDAAGPTDVLDGLVFAEGDRIELYNYRGGTFHAFKDANPLVVTVNGAVITSLADLHELDAASAAVTISEGSDDALVMNIQQASSVHTIEMLHLAHTYFA